MKKGDVIAFPTDTVYGLGARYDDLLGIEKIYQLKNRSISKKIPILCSSFEQVEKIAVLDSKTKKFLTNFWPGPLTIILDVKTPNSIYDKDVAIRIPNLKFTRDLLDIYGPLATTSCNISGKKELKNKSEILEVFKNKIDIIYDITKDITMSCVASTIIKFVDGKLEILRLGQITKEELEKYV